MGSDVMRRYLRCLVTGQAAGTGVPDGDSRLSIVRNYKFINTLSPDAQGRLRFYLSVTPAGVIHVTRGASRDTTVYPADATTPTGFKADALTGRDMYLVPDEIVPGHDTPVLKGSPPLYRVVNAIHSIQYSGASLYDSGNMTIDPVYREAAERAIPSTGSPSLARFIAPNNGAIIHNTNTFVSHAKSSATVVQLPRDTAYSSSGMISMTQRTGGIFDAPFVVPGSGNGVYAGYLAHPSLRTYCVEYTGLNPQASITVTSEVCLQYLVDPDETNNVLAKPSEITDSNVLQNFLGVLGASPLVVGGYRAVKSLVSSAVRTRAPMLAPLLSAT